MPNVYCVRADYGRYTAHCVKGGYSGIGWGALPDLSAVTTKEEIYALYKAAYPEDTSNVVIGQQVGQVSRFIFDIKSNDYVVTPSHDPEWIRFGLFSSESNYYFVANPDDECPYRHRRPVKWFETRLRRSDFSVPFQKTLCCALTVFSISQRDEFFTAIGKKEFVALPTLRHHDPYQTVITQLLELDEKEFEVLITHLLTAVGFDGSEHTGKPGDGGVDATGELNIANLARVKVFVQAKRYAIGVKISASTVQQLRQAIPFGGQGALITTAGFQKAAYDIALEPGFPRIGLVDGRQLVDLLIEYWNRIPEEFQDLLGLRPGLVLI